MIKAFLQPSIGRRIFLALMLATGLVWGSLYLTGRWGVFAPEAGDFDRTLQVTTDTGIDLIQRYGSQNDLVHALGGMAAHHKSISRVDGFPEAFVAFRVFRANGEVIATGGMGPTIWPSLEQSDGFFDYRTGGERFRVLRSRAENSDLIVEVSSSQRARDQIYDSVMFSSGAVLPVLFGFPLLLLPVWLAVRTGLSPLRRLSQELAGRKPDDLTPIRVHGVYRELSPVIAEMDAAFARIAQLIHRERSFLTDAAHELRTPLAVMVAQCENLKKAGTETERAQAIFRLEGGLARARRLVTQLLTLARLDTDVEQVFTSVDLADLARDHLAMHIAAARDKDVELCYCGPDTVPDISPMQSIESVLDNLIGNAVRYVQPGGRVEVGIERLEEGRLRLSVSDNGPGITPEERLLVFERFRRGRDIQQSGSGLGLSIVRTAAQRMNAEIETSDGIDRKGICFALTWSVRQIGPGI